MIQNRAPAPWNDPAVVVAYSGPPEEMDASIRFEGALWEAADFVAEHVLPIFNVKIMLPDRSAPPFEYRGGKLAGLLAERRYNAFETSAIAIALRNDATKATDVANASGDHLLPGQASAGANFEAAGGLGISVRARSSSRRDRSVIARLRLLMAPSACDRGRNDGER